MGFFKRLTPLEKEYRKLLKEEEKYLIKNEKERQNFLNKLLSDKVPQKLQSVLDAAFAKAFKLIFTSGSRAIELTYNKEKLENSYKLRDYTGDIKNNRKSLKEFNKKAKKQDNNARIVSGFSGLGMGILGIGIPDIPLFTGLMLRDIYETALSFGFSYDAEKERYFILLMIEGSVSSGDELCRINDQINDFIEHEKLPLDYSEDEEINKAAKALSKALLYMKFLQGIPLAGAVGGLYDAVYMKYIASYSTLKYKRRYLYKKMKAKGLI